MSSRAAQGFSASGQIIPQQQQAQQQQMDATKACTAAAALIDRCVDYDERVDTTLDNLSSIDNGLYQFDSRRLQLRRTVPIPSAILAQYDSLECKSFVGLLPEIARAFITIDNKLFLWNYHDGSDFLLYEELNQIIVSVALLRPRAGVFVSAVEFVLAVATPLEILLFALVFEEGNIHRSVQLFPTQFTVPSDETVMTSIVGTDQGRILLAGKDGGIYELEYWAGGGSVAGGAEGRTGSGWMGLFSGGGGGAASRQKCRKINHSAPRFRLLRSMLPGFLGGLPGPNAAAFEGLSSTGEQPVSSMVYDSSRNLLFTLSSVPVPRPGSNGGAGSVGIKSTLSCFSLGRDGWQLTLRSKSENLGAEVRARLSSVHQSNWEDLAPQSLPNGGTLMPDLHLVSLFVIPASESRVLVLMALTAHGHRLYFDLGETGMGGLRVRFVRLTPPAVSSEELNRGGAGGAMRGGVARVEPRFNKATSPSLVHAAYYRQGMLLMADAGRSALGDTLVAVARESHPAGGASSTSAYGGSAGNGGNKLQESLDAFDLESRIAELSEVSQGAQLNLLSSALFARHVVADASARGSIAQPLQGLTELATQHVTPPRHFLILTSSALLTLSSSRPLDELRHALAVHRRSGEEQGLQSLFHRYGAKEVGAMCLVLICAHAVPGAEQNADQVEQRGPSPGILSISSPDKMLAAGGAGGDFGSSSALSEEALRKQAKQAFFRVGEMSAQMAGLGMPYGAMVPQPGAGQLSSQVDSIALYLSRWMRSHWDWSLCVPATSVPTALGGGAGVAGAPAASAFLTFRFGKEYYVQLVQPLLRLQRFLQDNQRLLMRDYAAASSAAAAASGYSAVGGVSSAGLADPGRADLDALSSLQSLIALSLEIFHLLLLCLSQQDVAASAPGVASALLHSSPFLSSQDLQRLRDMKFLDVLTMPEGHALVRKLISTLAQGGASAAAAGSAGAFGRPGALLSPASLLSTPTGGRGKRARGGRDDGYGDSSDLVGSPSRWGSASSASLIAQLHAACPTFFGQSDLLYYNALDSLARARASWSLESERDAHLSSALDTFASFLHAPSFPLEEVAAKLKQVHQYEGIVALALQRAELLDRREVVRPAQTIAASAGFAPSSAGAAGLSDEEFYSAEKKRCITVLLDTLSVLILGVGAGGKQLSGASPSTDSTPSANGSSTSSPSAALSSDLSSSVPAPPLSPSVLPRARERVLAQILASPDESVPFALFQWYLDHELVAELYETDSELVPRFLASQAELVLHLKEYYLRRQRWMEAALLLNELARSRGEQYTLEQRMEFLSRSLLCARNHQSQAGPRSPARKQRTGLGSTASAGGLTSPELQDLMEQLKDRFEIAQIQSDIFSQLQMQLNESYSDAGLARIEASRGSQSPEVSQFLARRSELVDALHSLNIELLDLQALYLVCTRFGLWENCLAIFAFSGERGRGDVITALWKNILRARMAAAKKRGGGADWGEDVREKIVELARGETQYASQEFMFPLAFLVRELETYNVSYRAHPSETYVSETMLAAGITPARLLQTYEALLDEAEQGGGGSGGGNGDDGSFDVQRTNARGQSVQSFLFFSIYNVLRHSMEQELSSTSGRRVPFGASSGAASASHLFNKCLTSLRTLPPSEDTSRLAKLFQTLYARFNAATQRGV